MSTLQIKKTSKDDLDNIVTLWNDGDVMFYVGFPNGLGVTKDQLEKNWLQMVTTNNKRVHYSVYDDEIGYCGESHYSIQTDGSCSLDIKLFSKARGKNIAYRVLVNTIKEAFSNGADFVYVDPNKDNEKALNLYKRIGFVEHTHPNEELREKHFYLIINKGDFSTAE